MSQSKPISTLVSRFEIGFDAETKAEISALKSKMDELTRGLSAKNDSHGDRLLAAMQAEAANDAPQPELKQMGQWVFEGHPKEFVTAHVNSLGKAAISSMPIDDIEPCINSWGVNQDAQLRMPTCLYRELKGKFNATNWQNSAISRQPVNDVDYLSESVPEIQGMDAREIIIDELWPDKPAPQITQADMQLIFIKNLSDVLIQRMHSMDRFSEDDYAIGGDKLMPWDILIYEPLDAYAVLMRGPDQINVADLLIIREGGPMADAGWNTESEAFAILRTITEAELPAFRAALEVCYA